MLNLVLKQIWKKMQADLLSKDLSSWTATGQILDSWKATGKGVISEKKEKVKACFVDKDLTFWTG